MCRGCYRTASLVHGKKCSKCDDLKPLEDYYLDANGRPRYGECKKCFNRRSSESYQRHRTARLEYRRRWAEKNKDRIRAQDKKTRERRRLALFEHYGNGIAACVCCNEQHQEFLTLDHIAADGADHRRKLKQITGGNAAGWFIYKWLMDNNYPPGYQVLCFNCNVGKHRTGMNKCPHEIEREAARAA